MLRIRSKRIPGKWLRSGGGGGAGVLMGTFVDQFFNIQIQLFVNITDSQPTSVSVNFRYISINSRCQAPLTRLFTRFSTRSSNDLSGALVTSKRPNVHRNTPCNQFSRDIASFNFHFSTEPCALRSKPRFLFSISRFEFAEPDCPASLAFQTHLPLNNAPRSNDPDGRQLRLCAERRLFAKQIGCAKRCGYIVVQCQDAVES